MFGFEIRKAIVAEQDLGRIVAFIQGYKMTNRVDMEIIKFVNHRGDTDRTIYWEVKFLMHEKRFRTMMIDYKNLDLKTVDCNFIW